METIDEGEIYINGECLPEEGKDPARLRAEVGMVFQQFNLFSHMTIRANATLAPMKVRGAVHRRCAPARGGTPRTSGRTRRNIVAKVPHQKDVGLETKDKVNVDWWDPSRRGLRAIGG